MIYFAFDGRSWFHWSRSADARTVPSRRTSIHARYSAAHTVHCGPTIKGCRCGGAEFIEQTDTPLGIAERDQGFAQELYSNGRASASGSSHEMSAGIQ